MTDSFSIQLKQVGVRRGERWILRDINWAVPSGAYVAILGPNGSGKSTLARLLAGYMWATEGNIWVRGEHFGETDLNELRHSIRLIQAAGPYDVDPELTAREVVLTGLYGTIGLFDQPPSTEIGHADDLLEKVGLAGLSDYRYQTLSSGERVRALIARALIIKPRLLLLDEPTAGLDLLGREQVLATINALFTSSGDADRPTIVIITHHLEELGPNVSDILLLSQGQIAAHGPPERVLRGEVLTPVYGCPMRVVVDEGRFYARVDPSAWDGLLEP